MFVEINLKIVKIFKKKIEQKKRIFKRFMVKNVLPLQIFLQIANIIGFKKIAKVFRVYIIDHSKRIPLHTHYFSLTQSTIL